MTDAVRRHRIQPGRRWAPSRRRVQRDPTADLILTKRFAARPKDLEDIRLLSLIGPEGEPPVRWWRGSEADIPRAPNALRTPDGRIDAGRAAASSEVMERTTANVGATIMGRNMFGGHPGPWKPDTLWNGWWGDTPPFHHPVFVLTQFPREPLVLRGGTTFTFVTGGIVPACAYGRAAVDVVGFGASVPGAVSHV